MRHSEFGLRLFVLVFPLSCASCGSSSSGGPASSAGSFSDAGSTSAAGAGVAGDANAADAGADTSGGTSASGGSGGSGGSRTSHAGSGSGGRAGGAGAGAAGAPSSAAEQFAPIVSAFCSAARTCCSKQNVEAMLADCETEFATRQTGLASVDQGTVTVDAAALAKCSAAYQRAATDCDENTLLATCVGVFLGTKGSGGACTNAYECNREQGPMTCLFASNATVGACKPVPHGKAGDACLGTCPANTDCSSVTAGAADTNITLCFESDHLYCDISSSSPACKSLLTAGDDCTTDAACGSDSLCNTTCQPSGMLHDPCGAGCRPDLACGADGKCQDLSLANGGVCSGYAPAP